MDLQKTILHERRRGDCYKLLAACFYLPQKRLFAKEKLFKNLTMLLNSVCKDAGVFSAKMEEAISKYSDEELSVEYASLFVGPFELKAPPYGSVYIDRGKRVMSDSTIEVVKMYDQTGLTINDDFKELPDHIAIELEFMYYLIHKELEALERSEQDRGGYYKKTQEEFLNNFLIQWVPPFCEKIKAGTNNEFYRMLASCLLNFVTKSHVMDQTTEPLKENSA